MSPEKPLSRRGFIRGAGLAALAFVAKKSRRRFFWRTGRTTVTSDETTVPAGDGPNILLVVTDDLDVDSVAHMPQLQRHLSEKGVTFANSFVTQTICSPARASILTGQYPHNHGIVRNGWEGRPDGGWEAVPHSGYEHSTIATWLHADGYRTAFLGKYMNLSAGPLREGYVPPGWDEWRMAAGKYYDYQMIEDGRIHNYGHSPEDYETDVLAGKAVGFIRRAASTDGRPWFLFVSPNAPHDCPDGLPPIPAPRHEDAFAGAAAPRTPSFNEAMLKDKPWPNRPLLTSDEIGEIDHKYRKRLETMLSVDEMIGSLLDALEDTGQLESTYIVFTSDNGFHMGQHRLRSGKALPYEEDIRVPLIVRGPGVPAGQVREHLVLNNDLAPTLAELAGASTTEFVDGRSLVPLLTTDPPALGAWRQSFLVEYWAPSLLQAGDMKQHHAIRTRDHLYVEYSGWRPELYHVRNDPYQLQNLYRSARPELISQLECKLQALRECGGANCRDAEQATLEPSSTYLPLLS